MNKFEKFVGQQGEAKVYYMGNDYQILSPGSFVVCVVTGQHIPLHELHYWSEERQEAYSSPEAALIRHQQVMKG